jgi:hypothetical protein
MSETRLTPPGIADCRRRTAALFVGSVLLLLPGAFWGVPSGKSVAGALVILDGGVPYRDFWSMYAPGQFYAVAALYWLFGDELVVQGMATVLIVSATAVIVSGLMRRLGARCGTSLILGAVFTLMSWTTGPELFDYPLALPSLLLALDRTLRYLGGEGVTHLRGSGLWLGLAAWFKHDVAAYVAFATAIALFVSWSAVRRTRPAAWVSPWRATMITGGFAIAMALPMALWTAATAGADAWDDLFVFPATVFRHVRTQYFPPLIPDAAPVLAWLTDPLHVRKALRAAAGLSTWIVLYVPVVMLLGGLGALVFGFFCSRACRSFSRLHESSTTRIHTRSQSSERGYASCSGRGLAAGLAQDRDCVWCFQSQAESTPSASSLPRWWPLRACITNGREAGCARCPGSEVCGCPRVSTIR